jgi:hypothetical protein
MMGIVAIDVEQTVEYSLQEDEGEQKTVFKLRALDALERSFVSNITSPSHIGKSNGANEATQDDEKEAIYVQSNEATLLTVMSGSVWALRLALLGWTRFSLADGKDVPLERETVVIPGVGKREVLKEDLVLRRFKSQWIGELSGEILRLSRLSGEQRKN